MIPVAQPQYKQTLHLVHFVLFVMTFGLWTPVWIIATVMTASHNNAQRRWYIDACAYQAWQLDQYNRAQWERQRQLAVWQAQQLRPVVQAPPRRALPR